MQHFSYALYPHAGDWKQAHTVERGYEFNYPLTATQEPVHTGKLPAMYSYVFVSSPDVILTGMKKAEDSNSLILRMYESAGKTEQVRVTVPAGARHVAITNLMENEDGASVPLSDRIATVSIHPYEILTLKVSYMN